MADQIIDKITVGIPGPIGDVTPAAQAAQAAAESARDEAEAARDEAETFSASTEALQDSAVSALIADRDTTTRQRLESGLNLPLDVLVITGQSNGMHSDGVVAKSVTFADDRVMKWDQGAGHPVRFAADDDQIGLWMAQVWRRRHPDRRVLVIPGAVGNTGLIQTDSAEGTWDPDNTSNPINCWRDLQTMWAAAKSWVTANWGVDFASNTETAVEGEKIVPRAIVWAQGENDMGSTSYPGASQQEYAAKLDELFGLFQTEFGDQWHQIPIVIRGLNPALFEDNFEGRPFPNPVQDALEDTPRRVSWSAFVPVPRELEKYGERIHASVEGQQVWSELAVDAIPRAAGNHPANRPMKPRNLRVRQHGTKAVISWDPPLTRALGYKVQWTTGEQWMTTSPRTPLHTDVTVPCQAGDVVQARIITWNEVGFTEWSAPVPRLRDIDAVPGARIPFEPADLSAGSVSTWQDRFSMVQLAVSGAAPTAGTVDGVPAVSFNGDGALWQRQDVPVVSIAAVVKLSDTPVNDWNIIAAPYAAGLPKLWWAHSISNLQLNGGAPSGVEFTNVTAGWHVVVGTWDGTQGRLTLDGTTHEATIGAPNQIAGAIIGGQPDDTSMSLTGALAYVGLFDIPLSQTQQQAVCSSLTSRFSSLLP